MKFDGYTLSRIIKQFKDKICNSRIKKIRLSGREFFYFDIEGYRKKNILLISLAASNPFFGLTGSSDLLKDAKGWDNRFIMLLNKYIRNGKIVSVDQIDMDRVVTLEFEKRDDGGNIYRTILCAELTGRSANLILFEKESRKILGAVHYFSPSGQQLRPIVPNAVYEFPKSVGIFMNNANKKRIIDILSRDDLLISDLNSLVQGFSKKTWQSLNLFFSDRIKDFSTDHSAFEYIADNNSFNSMVECINEYMPEENLLLFNPDKWSRDQFLLKLKKEFYDYKKVLKSSFKRLLRKIKGVQKDLKETDKMENLKLHADLLMAYPDKAEPKAESVNLENFYTDEVVNVTLDPSLSSIENADKFYRKYRKLKKRLTLCNKNLDRLKNDEFFIEEQLLFIDEITFEDSEGIEQLVLSTAEYIKKSSRDNRVFTLNDREKIYRISCTLFEKFPDHYRCFDFKIPEISKRKKKGSPAKFKKAGTSIPTLKEYTGIENVSILIGSGSLQNDFLTFKVARKEDLWFHAREIPGAHVIARISGKNISEESEDYKRIIEICSGLAAYFSKASTNSRVTVQYTLKKHLRKTRDLPPGMTLVPKESTVTVKPFCPENEKIRSIKLLLS